MTAHPVDLVLIDGVAVDKAAERSLWKQRERLVVADVNEVRNTDLSGQFGGIYVRSLDANFKLDTNDIQADDGINVIIDYAGNHFVKLVPSIAEVDKIFIATGDVTIADDETADNILINNTSGAPINVRLPSAAARSKRIGVTDIGGNAGTYPITVFPKSATSQTIMTGASYTLDVNGMGISLRPLASGAGYF